MKKKRTSQSVIRSLCALIWLTLVFALGTSAYADTITITNTNDSGPGSLRQALLDAHDGDTITFAVSGTISLTSGGLLIAKNVTISGPGSNQLSIDGNQAVLVFGVFPGKTAAISGLTVTNGQYGIWNEQATLSVSSCVVSGNSADGLYNHEGTLTVSNCVLSLNAYGGVFNDHAALTITNCIVNGNASYGLNNHTFDLPPPKGRALEQGFVSIDDSIISGNSGPGVINQGNVTIINSTLAGNSVQGGFGGAVSSGSFKTPGNVVTVIDSTISGNSAQGGGGISNDYGLVSIVNSTISDNSATDGGGAIFNYAGAVQFANSTISGNSAGSGGGVYNVPDQFGAARIETGNTIFNAGASGENIFNDGGTVTSDGYNLSSDDGGGYLNGPGDQINTDPLLAPLQDNGGSTLTHMPLPGSPAIDAGESELYSAAFPRPARPLLLSRIRSAHRCRFSGGATEATVSDSSTTAKSGTATVAL
jgi:hypothetical protein